MKLTSSVFKQDESIPKKYTCDGSNTNPPLTISDVPSNAKSLVLIMDDPDVPKYVREDQMWDHWVMFNLSPQLTTIEEGKEPQGSHGLNTGGEPKYMGPCPPDREHRYFFKLYALDTTLDLQGHPTKLQVEQAMDNHIIAESTLMGTYERQ